ncbi:tetratricopeptide (TPR) repeat protein [Arthrobacter sp. TE12231]
MAEHNDGNRGGKARDNTGGAPYRGTSNSGGDPRGFRARDDRKPYGDRAPREGGEQRSYGGGDRKPYAGGGDRKPYGDRAPREGGAGRSYGGGDRKPYGDRAPREGGEQRSYGGGDRKPYAGGDRKPYSGGGDRKPYGDRAPREGGEQRSYGGGDRKPYAGSGDRKPYGDRAPREGGAGRSFSGGDRKPYAGGDRKPYGDRAPREGGDQRSYGGGDRKPYAGGDRKPYGDRAPREGGAGRSFGGGDRDRKPYSGGGDRDRKPYSGGDNRKPFGNREDRPARSFDRGDSGPRQFGRDRPEDRPVRVPNAADLRSANRPDRERSPQIDEDVTGKELDRATQHQIKTLEGTSAEWVARHLVMAGRLLDEEPELAFQHALAASRRGGRLASVREAVGLTAYAAGHYGEALREFRTYRRISGSNMHLPVMADCERGLGRPDRALDMARSEEAKDLDAPGKVELAIVAAGARTDLGQLDAAVSELEIAQLDINRAFSYSPRLFRAYAEALTAAGRAAEAAKWQRQAVVAENALGLGAEEEPDIIDLGWDEEEEAREEERQRRLRAQEAQEVAAAHAGADERALRVAGAAVAAEVTGAAAAETALNPIDEVSDDAEAGHFESDDAESDQDSLEADVLDESDEETDEESDAIADQEVVEDSETAQRERVED